jgi:hypothetical protein
MGVDSLLDVKRTRSVHAEVDVQVIGMGMEGSLMLSSSCGVYSLIVLRPFERPRSAAWSSCRYACWLAWPVAR